MRILLIVYDNDSVTSWFPQGLAYIASICRNAGHEVVIYSQDIYHWPEEHLTRTLDNEKFDIVGISVIGGYYQYRKLLKISEAVNASKNRPFYILGGHGPAPEPEYFLKKTKADVIVIGEGEVTILEIIEALQSKLSFQSVKGIAFMENNRCIITPPRVPTNNIDDIPFPAWDLFDMTHYTKLRFVHMANSDILMPVLSGRGCPFRCNFCYRMVEGFRPRSVSSIIEEIEILRKGYNISYILFSDELLMSSVKRTEELCKGLIKANIKVKWTCNGRLNYATPSVLKLMKQAGCVFINYGIEAMDDEVLQKMKKALTTKQIIKGIEATLNADISPGFNIIFGNIGDNRETLNKGVEFLLKYDDGAQMRTIRPVTPYPGSPLYYYAIKRGLLKDCEDFYENKHTNSDLLAVNFTELNDEEFYQELGKANEALIKNYYHNTLEATLEKARNLYRNKDASFRGFR